MINKGFESASPQEKEKIIPFDEQGDMTLERKADESERRFFEETGKEISRIIGASGADEFREEVERLRSVPALEHMLDYLNYKLVIAERFCRENPSRTRDGVKRYEQRKEIVEDVLRKINSKF
jgi:hypothetical protein